MTLVRPWRLRDLVRDIQTGRSTPIDAFDRMHLRTAEVDGTIQAWVAPPSGEARGSTGPLGGIPMGVKDIIDVAGLPTLCGSPLRAGARPAARDADIVAAWASAGAVPAGKTVTTEFAYFAPGPTRNPHRTTHTPGGSSSGSAAAVASGILPLALGSQTAASVTRPASYCGVAALVMSRGAFSTRGVFGLAESLDAHGLFTATVDDLSLAWAALRGVPEPAPIAAPRLRVWSPPGLEPSMSQRLADAADAAHRAGAVVAPLESSAPADLTAAHPVIMQAEAFETRVDAREAADGVSPQLTALLRAGEHTSDAQLEGARATVVRAGAELRTLLAEVDAILAPAALGPAPRGLEATGDPVLSRPWQALGLPVVVIPSGEDDDGLPLGLQLIGAPGGDGDLLAVGRWLEHAISSLA